MKVKRILLVEDNVDDADLTIRALRKCGITNEVVLASDGVQALELVGGTGATEPGATDAFPGLVLLDLNLPRMDGLEVLKRMRADARLQFVPTIILSSSRERSDIRSAYELGANSYLLKPVDFDEFIQTVEQVGVYWLLLNQTPEA